MIKRVALIGTGVMGMGIAQIIAQAGIEVSLFDAKEGAAITAKDKLQQALEKLTNKGKITEEAFAATLEKLVVIDDINAIAQVDLVIEAIVENLAIKQQLLKQLEDIVRPDAILATNTSSLSVTSIASVCQNPERVAGFHFFNPVPLMKIVEVIAGLATNQSTIDALLQLAHQIGHLGVFAKDTPGFIVNHAGRAYNTEALKILGEGIASTSAIDRILRDGAGFRMGPFELMDLTALDVSHPAMESIYNQYYQDPRYRPHPLTRQMLAGNKIGRKVGEGFYRYIDGKAINIEAVPNVPNIDLPKQVYIAADLETDREILAMFCQSQSVQVLSNEQSDQDSLIILATYGEDTTNAALRYQLDPSRCVAIDMLTDFECHRTLMPSLITQPIYLNQAHALFSHFANPTDKTGVTIIQESIGFIAQRVLAMVVNLACDIAAQQIANVQDIDNAVRLGLGYPYGPISWGDKLQPARVLLILERIHQLTNDPRYRPSPWLQRRAKLDLSLFFEPNYIK